MTEATLARAFIQLIPTTKGAQEHIVRELVPEAERASEEAGRKGGRKFGASLAAGIAAGGAAVAGVGAALYGIGKSVDDMNDTIAISSGATGEALRGLENDAKQIARSIPASFDDVGGSVAAFNTFVGATGESLQGLSVATLEASRLLGEDGVANSEAFGRAMKQWQVDAEDGPEILDALFRGTQDYGVSLSGLIGHLNSYGPVLANVGFTMEESAALFSQLESGGISVSRVMPALNKSFRDWAGEGKNVQAELARTVDAIKNAEDGTEALAIATDVFGAQGASRMTAAIRSGTLELDNLADVLADSDGAIAASAAETDSFSEKWQQFKNNALLAVEPVATRVFDAISDGMGWIVDYGIPAAENFAAAIGDGWAGGLEEAEGPLETVGALARELFEWINDTAIPAVSELVEWVRENKDLMVTLAGAIGGATAAYGVYRGVVIAVTAAKNAAAAAQRVLNAVMRANPIGLVVTAIGFLVGALVALYHNNEDVREVVDAVWAAIKTAIGAVVDWFVETAWPWIKGAMDDIGDAMSWVWENVIRPVWDAIQSHIDWVSGILIDTVFPALSSAVEAVGETFERISDGIGTAWDRIREAAAIPVNFVIDTVYNNGIRAVWNTIAEKLGLSFTLPHVQPVTWGQSSARGGGGGIAHVAMADGGILPGYTPGRDVHTFISPTGGVLELSGGEPILRPEVGRVLGASWVHGVNAAARRGGTAGVAAFLGGGRQAFAEGGFWNELGGAWSRTWRGAVGTVQRVGGAIKDVVLNAAQFIADPIGGVMDLVGGPVEDLLGSITGNPWVQLLTELPRRVVSGLADKARELVNNLFGGGDGPAFKAGGPVGQIPGALAHVNAAAWNIAHAVGGVRGMQAINQSMAGGHPEGRAVDFLGTTEVLNAVAAYAAANHRVLGLDYIAWQGRLFRDGRGWFPQTRGFGNDPFHRWHVHIEWPRTGYAGVFDEGGWIPPGRSVIENRTGKWEALANVTSAIENGAGGARWVAEVHHYDGASSDELAEDLLFAMRRLDRGGKYAREGVLS